MTQVNRNRFDKDKIFRQPKFGWRKLAYLRYKNAARAGRRITAPSILNKNIKVSNIPMSAWNWSADINQVLTPMASVNPVKKTALPVKFNVLRKASEILSPARIKITILENI